MGQGHSSKHLLKKKMQAVDRAVLVQGQEDTSCPSMGPTGTCQGHPKAVTPISSGWVPHTIERPTQAIQSQFFLPRVFAEANNPSAFSNISPLNY